MIILKKIIFPTILLLVLTSFVKINNKVSVDYIDKNKALDENTEKAFKEIIYKTYPKLMRKYNPHAITDLKVIIKSNNENNGAFVAYASGNTVTVSTDWMLKNPHDFDLMTHEIMHLIQAYPNGAGPGWLTEGIADYVRDKYGLNNEKAGWKLTNYNSNQHYTNSYRITARFLKWIENQYNKNLVKKLDNSLRKNQYSTILWGQLTGKNLDELWSVYSANPIIN
ncbi:basic secretory protein-like protein [Mariniflexile litorale]|uniref:Basic secretory protein-like protein n=1 Tax=Mariniflexile litorale TaxID=3045158 RepID=A0AAU7EHE3_9FLAO|nr:basic secretory protein-like protein [Mariniflexile sp. KMM 9835]MDQ8211949.1 basic secretory protein-like protein [Mariniflexile sp. KMM 9835]